MGDSGSGGTRADQGVRPTKTTGAAWSRTHNPSSLRGSRPVEHCIPRNRKTDKTADYRSCSAHHRGGDAPSNAGAELVLLASASCRSDRHAASRARRRADQGIGPRLPPCRLTRRTPVRATVLSPSAAFNETESLEALTNAPVHDFRSFRTTCMVWPGRNCWRFSQDVLCAIACEPIKPIAGNAGTKFANGREFMCHPPQF